jgi:tetratricopeptide (TPR) repeat protein
VTETLLERYKAALKAGHVALLREQLEDAAEHYAAAARIAPDRPLPNASLGGVLLRLDRTAEALEAFEAALRVAPDDQAALLGRADALVALGRTADAASTMARLAETYAAGGRADDAGVAWQGAAALGYIPEPAAERPPDPVASALPEWPAADLAQRRPPGSALGDAPPGDEPPPAAEEAAADLVPMPPDDPDTLLAAADGAAASGAPDAVGLYLIAARAYRDTGAVDAALEACQRAMGSDPGSAALHLELARLYMDRGWTERAGEKLVLLDRLLALRDDTASRHELRSVAASLAPGTVTLPVLAEVAQDGAAATA